MIPHPIAIGKLKVASPIIFQNNGTQKIKLTSLKVVNETLETQTITVTFYARGVTNYLCQVAELPGKYKRELIDKGGEINIDPGGMILGYCETGDNKVSFILDGDEDYNMRVNN